MSGITLQEYDPKGCVEVVHLFFSQFFYLVAPLKTDMYHSILFVFLADLSLHVLVALC